MYYFSYSLSICFLVESFVGIFTMILSMLWSIIIGQTVVSVSIVVSSVEITGYNRFPLI